MKIRFLMPYQTEHFEVKENEVVDIEKDEVELAHLYIKNGIAVEVKGESKKDDDTNTKLSEEQYEALMAKGLKNLKADELKQICEFVGVEYQSKDQAIEELSSLEGEEE